MFGWLSHRAFLSTFEKTWVEYRMRWLVDQFGLAPLKSMRVIEPTQEFFPNPWIGSVEQTHDLFNRICEWMLATRNTLELRIALDSEIDSLGLYSLEEGIGKISVASSQLTDLERLIGTLAHEVAHHRLLAEGRLRGDENDHEWVTDLLPLYFGLGIFAANSVLREAQKLKCQSDSHRPVRPGSRHVDLARGKYCWRRAKSRHWL